MGRLRKRLLQLISVPFSPTRLCCKFWFVSLNAFKVRKGSRFVSGHRLAMPSVVKFSTAPLGAAAVVRLLLRPAGMAIAVV